MLKVISGRVESIRICLVPWEWGQIVERTQKKVYYTVGMRLLTEHVELEEDVILCSQPACFPVQNVLCVSRDCLSELEDSVKQWVGEGWLRGEVLFYPMKVGTYWGAQQVFCFRIGGDTGYWIWRNKGRSEICS